LLRPTRPRERWSQKIERRAGDEALISTEWLNFGLREAPKVQYNRSRARSPRGYRMLCALSKQISHCYFRAAECRELAARCVSPFDRRFYTEREQAWLTLARSYEFQERLSQMVTELSRNEWHGGLPPEQGLWIRPPQCPSCSIQMQYQLRRPVKHAFVHTSLSFERALFACTNCRLLGDQLVAISSD
jgi:hypothetical protein